MSTRDPATRWNGGMCAMCAADRPPGRVKYCSDTCAQSAGARTRVRRAGELSPCAGCGGPKDIRGRGKRFCSECERLQGDAVRQREHENSRRQALQNLQEKLGAGKRIKSRRIDAPEGQKWCARCQAFRPFTSFPGRTSDRKGSSYCKPCQRSYNQERRLKLIYGLTWDEYDLLLLCQDNRCAICERQPRGAALAVDHDHKTGEIRGLLCRRCNHRLLGSANDDPARLRKAADYLEAYGPREVFGESKIIPGYFPTPEC